MLDCRGLKVQPPPPTAANPLPLQRFRPPHAAFPRDVAWAIERAYGPVPDAAARRSPPNDAHAAAEAARILDLAPRIATRVPGSALRGELGDAATHRLVAARGVAALGAGSLLDVARHVAQQASDLGVPAVFVKGIALHATGRVSVGARWLSDVDVLVPEGRVAELTRALQTAGFEAVTGCVESEHQASPLRWRGQTVEIHRFLPGVTLPGRQRFATADDLLVSGQVEPLSDWPSGSAAPSPRVLVAHALVHGLVQHGLAPRSYPLTRMLADLIDLGLGASEVLAQESLGLLTRQVSAAEALAVRQLCAALLAGEVPHASSVLRHAVFGLTDDRYAASLKLRALGSGPSTLARPFAFAREAWRAVFPGRDRLRGLYGSEGSDLARAVWRPLDLGWRLARIVWSAIGPSRSARPVP